MPDDTSENWDEADLELCDRLWDDPDFITDDDLAYWFED